jgi:hypothetical protein
MTEILLLRTAYNQAGVFGTFCVDPRGECQPIAVSYELPWKGNVPQQSCIPEGSYKFKVEKHEKGGAAKAVLRLFDVPARAGILVHIGNNIDDSSGCILAGEQYERYKEKPGVLLSVKGMLDLLSYIKGGEGILHIRKAHYDL